MMAGVRLGWCIRLVLFGFVSFFAYASFFNALAHPNGDHRSLIWLFS
jgi:predicted CDP-diglyceride synthetase/phosphatidate cytidylyltransferase